MNAETVIEQSRALGIPLTVNGGRLHVGAPVESVPGDLLQALKQHKAAIMALLAGNRADPVSPPESIGTQPGGWLHRPAQLTILIRTPQGTFSSDLECPAGLPAPAKALGEAFPGKVLVKYRLPDAPDLPHWRGGLILCDSGDDARDLLRQRYGDAPVTVEAVDHGDVDARLDRIGAILPGFLIDALREQPEGAEVF